MTKEEKELVYKDLGARLPYEVIIKGTFPEMNWDTEEVEDKIETKTRRTGLCIPMR